MGIAPTKPIDKKSKRNDDGPNNLNILWGWFESPLPLFFVSAMYSVAFIRCLFSGMSWNLIPVKYVHPLSCTFTVQCSHLCFIGDDYAELVNVVYPTTSSARHEYWIWHVWEGIWLFPQNRIQEYSRTQQTHKEGQRVLVENVVERIKTNEFRQNQISMIKTP